MLATKIWKQERPLVAGYRFQVIHTTTFSLELATCNLQWIL
jgi:hypothetical protein